MAVEPVKPVPKAKQGALARQYIQVREGSSSRVGR